jgi:hypothetical protein
MTFQAVGHGAVFSDVAADGCTGILEGIAPMPASTKAGLERVVDEVAPARQCDRRGCPTRQAGP